MSLEAPSHKKNEGKRNLRELFLDDLEILSETISANSCDILVRNRAYNCYRRPDGHIVITPSTGGIDTETSLASWMEKIVREVAAKAMDTTSSH